MLKLLFGDDALVRILDFLLENRFWDYTKTDIAREAGVSRVQVHRVWHILEKFGIVQPSRKIGASTLYKANINSPIFKKLSELSLEIASKAHEETIKEEEEMTVPAEA